MEVMVDNGTTMCGGGSYGRQRGGGCDRQRNFVNECNERRRDAKKRKSVRKIAAIESLEWRESLERRR
jgi:hypothetical protein